MFKSMHERIGLIATEDSDREDELGVRCPSSLRIILKNGVVIEKCYLSDGVNGHDKKTIDVIEPAHDVPGGAQVWVIATSAIAVVHQTYPSEEQIAGVRARNPEIAKLAVVA